MLHLLISVTLFVMALLPLLMIVANLSQFRKADSANSELDQPKISVLVPARNEANSIGQSLQTLIAQTYKNVEILVLDDHSEDRTGDIVSEFANRHSHIRLLESQSLPAGWNGKQFACWQLAQQASGEYFLFLDADVRLQSDAIDRIWTSYQANPTNLYSGFPAQHTGSFAERMLIPLMYLLLMSYLPLRQSRIDQRVSMAAGCGQMFFTDRDSYLAVDGHSAIRSSRHDGLMLPRAYRARGKRTDLFDASDLATCRMYHNVREVTVGLLKNACEGIANKRLIVVFTILLLGGFVLPLLMFLHGLFWKWDLVPLMLLGLATVLSLLPRCLVAARWERNYLAAVLNPVAIVWFVALQWLAFIRGVRGKSVAWRGRST
jgi:hypothetical protein